MNDPRRSAPQNRLKRSQRPLQPGRRDGLLDVTCHVPIEYYPNDKWAIDALEILEDVGIGNFKFDAEILLFIYVNRLRKAERCEGCRFAVRDLVARLIPHAATRREKPCWHLNH